ncbi:MAG: ABC transporter permease subunit, partial [Gloeomargaritaceae cyanobacterium C42_A2020_066]|nr:ABC transporter permease subunit [Gloeomargaritaceae cyanobacterium C42_A2020_066]
MTRPLTRENETLDRTTWTWQDGLFLLALIALLLVIVRTATNFTGAYDPKLTIHTHLSVLPSYTAQTLLRMAAAYVLSLVFSLIYAYTAYRSRPAAQILIPLLDILQSIPVLSFLPGVVLALITLFPGQRLGVEIAAIILIFTGMTWNMTFSFYQSLTSIPRELQEAAQVYRLNLWQRFWTLELPAGAIGLVWNSVMSVAGGWFFLMAIESFTVGRENFRLPGLGSFLATAADQGQFGAILGGLAVLIGVIIVLDFFLWRPLIAWAEKFKFETVESAQVPQSAVLDFLRRSPTLRALTERAWLPLLRWLDTGVNRTLATAGRWEEPTSPGWTRLLGRGVMISFAGIVLWGTWEAVLLLQTLDLGDWQQVMVGSLLTAV